MWIGKEIKLSNYHMIVINYNENKMKERNRYLIKEKKKSEDGSIPSSPSIREWEVVKTTNDYCKVVDLVDYVEMAVQDSMFGKGFVEKHISRGKEQWISFADILTKYDILEEL